MTSGNSSGSDQDSALTIGASSAVYDRPLVQIPDHELLRRIGQGSYGEVWLARNMMGIFRAIKIVRRQSFKDDRPFEREISGIRQFEPISRSHEGFVDILHVGINESRSCFYYVMELGDDQLSGQTINPDLYCPKTLASEIAGRGALPVQEVISLGLSLSGTLAELHRHGLVHRDIKPSNIIFVNGAPKLADIGLVTEANAAMSFVGTAGFIAPEGPGTARADIYSLGKVLYEASTGNDRQDFPALPTVWESSPDHDRLLELNEVFLKACRFDAGRRHASAHEMQSELVVVANGKSIKRLRLLEQRWSNLKRLTGAAAIVLALSGLLLREIYSRWKSAVNARQQQVGAYVAYGNQAMETGDFPGALPYFAEVFKLDDGNSQNEAAHRLRLGSLLAQCPKISHFWPHEKQIATLQFSPDGKQALVAEAFGRARIYDLQTGQIHGHPFGQEQALSGASYSPDGRHVITTSEDSTAVLWTAGTLHELRRIEHPNRVYNASFNASGDRFITCCKDGVARIWETGTGELVMALRGHTNAVAMAQFSHDGKLVATAGRDGTARLWNAKDGTPAGPILPHGKWVYWVAFSPDDGRLITTSDDHNACVWEVPSGRRVLPNLRHKDMVVSAGFSPDGKRIFTACFDGTVHLWRADLLEPLETNPVLRHSERVRSACISPDGTRILTGCTDGSARIWTFEAGPSAPVALKRTYSSNGNRYVAINSNQFGVFDVLNNQPIFSAASSIQPELTRAGAFAFAVDAQPAANFQGSRVRVWRKEGETSSIEFTNSFSHACLSEDGSKLLVYEGRIYQLWNTSEKQPRSKMLELGAAVKGAVFSRDSRLAAVFGGNEVTLLNTHSGTNSCPPLTHSVSVSCVDFSPDGSRLLTACTDEQLTKCYAQLWRTRDGVPGHKLPHRDGVLCASFSPDGKRIVTASEDFSAQLWNAETGTGVAPALKHQDRVLTAYFSSNGRWVVTTCADSTARVWSAETGEPLTPPFRHADRIYRARFISDGRSIVTADNQGQSWIWPLDFERREAADVADLARLLSGGAGPVKSEGPSEPIDKLWLRVRSRYQ